MIVRNDCVKQDTIMIEVNGICTTTTDLIAISNGPTQDELDQILMLMEQYKKCCINNTMLLQQQQQMIKDIMSQISKCCCNGPVYVGQIVKDFTIIDITPKPKQIYNPPSQPLPRQLPPTPITTPYVPIVDKSAFSIMGTGGSWKIVNGDIVSGGVSLRRNIPITLNIKNGDKILQCIIDYRVVMGGGLYPKQEPILVYQILNTTTGTRTTFEAGPNHYRSWFK